MLSKLRKFRVEGIDHSPMDQFFFLFCLTGIPSITEGLTGNFLIASLPFVAALFEHLRSLELSDGLYLESEDSSVLKTGDVD